MGLSQLDAPSKESAESWRGKHPRRQPGAAGLWRRRV
jgi:hypothetical protein